MTWLLWALKHWRVLLAAGAVMGAYAWGHSSANKSWQAKWNKHEAAVQSALAIEQGKQRAIEQERQRAVDEARAEVIREQEKNAAITADLLRSRLDVGRLRNELSAYAAGPASGDTVAACRADAAALADALAAGAELLDNGRRLVVETAQAHDDRAAEVRALIGAWPNNQQSLTDVR